MFWVVKIAAMSAVLAAATVIAMEPTSPVAPRTNRLVVEFEPLPSSAPAPVRPVRVISPDRRPVPPATGSAAS